MFYASATDLAIALAAKNGTLRLVERPTRFGEIWTAIEDDRGVIEVHPSMAEAQKRVTEATR